MIEPPKLDPNCEKCEGLGWRTFHGEPDINGIATWGFSRCECGYPYMEYRREVGRKLQAEIRQRHGFPEPIVVGDKVTYHKQPATVVRVTSRRVWIVYTDPMGNQRVSRVLPTSIQKEQQNEKPE